MNDSYESRLNAHYGRPDLGQAILDWLKAQGKDLDALTVQDLAPADQYHGGALPSTVNLAQLAGIEGPLKVADLGGGLGGPARYLASALGCSVDVADLARDFCSSGALLTKQMRLDDKVRFFCESATKTSLPSGAYDVVWMQNAAMNIEDRPALYTEIRRLLKDGGTYVFQESCAGDVAPAYYPTGWASDAEESFIYKPEQVLGWLLAAGFRVLTWADETQSMEAARRAQNQARLNAASTSSVPLPHYTSPEQLRRAAEASNLNSAEGRVRLVRARLQKL